MAANNKANVSTTRGVVGGYFFSAPLGTTDVPSAANFTSWTPGNDWENQGYVPEDGFTESASSDGGDDLRDINLEVVDTVSGSVTETLNIGFMEIAKNPLSTQYGHANVTDASGSITVQHKWSNASENRMFHVDDLGEKARKTFGKITDRQYYDFWASVGGPAYSETRPLITSLWNKHRLSLLNHGVKDADHVAWVLTAQAALELARQLYEKALDECMKGFGLPRDILRKVFGQFSPAPIENRWRRALLLLAPDSNFPLESTERKNIEHGLTQLCEAWMNPTILYNSTMTSVEDYEELFATKGYQKKAMREIAEVRDETMIGV